RVSKAADLGHELFRAGNDEAGGVGRADATLLGSVPLAMEGYGFGERGLGGFAEPAWGRAGIIHQAFTDVCADSALFHRTVNRVCVTDGAHIEQACRSAREEFVDPEECACVQGLGSVAGFHYPDFFAEPIEELEVVG